jgi:hypothetical protein
MNAVNRKRIESIKAKLEDIDSEIQDLESEEQEKFDNLSDGLKCTEQDKRSRRIPQRCILLPRASNRIP